MGYGEVGVGRGTSTEEGRDPVLNVELGVSQRPQGDRAASCAKEGAGEAGPRLGQRAQEEQKGGAQGQTGQQVPTCVWDFQCPGVTDTAP